MPQVGKKSLAKVVITDHCISNGCCYQNDSDGSKDGQRISNWQILRLMSWLVHANKLEDKVCKTSYISAHDSDAASLVLATSEESCCKENENSNWDSGNREDEFGGCDVTTTGNCLS